MYSTEGICDWCKKHSLLIRHEYLDGKCHHSCESCNYMAKIDVGLFNAGEIAMRNKQTQQHNV